VKETPETIQKKAFAAFCLKHGGTTAECAVEFGGSDSAIIAKMISWAYDPVFIAHQEHLIDTLGEAAYLPTEAEIKRDILRRARNAESPKEYAAIMDVYVKASAMGKAVSGGAGSGGQRAIYLPSIEDPDAWERKAMQQQQKLIDASR
jgi:hypothetical protein